MSYLANHELLRSDPRLLLDGAQSVISFAFPYYSAVAHASQDYVARYALGDDYHEVVRRRLDVVAQKVRDTFGGDTRVCVDTAPLRERYWAARSGIGFIGLNGHLIIPGAGSYFFLAELLTTVAFRPTETPDGRAGRCEGCGRCVKACPGGAIGADGSFDASKCLSYLTIEHRGDFPDGTNLHGCLYGCDVCSDVCPHNANPPITIIAEFAPRPAVVALTAERVGEMSRADFSTIFRHSAIKRAKLAGLQRNARKIQ